MKKSLFILVLLLAFSFTHAQKSNLIFFSEGGEKFYVILNSVLQNQGPSTNVKITGLTAPNYKLKILFRDTSITPIEKNLLFTQGKETTFNIKKDSNDQYAVRYFSEVPISRFVPPSPGQMIIPLSTSGQSMPVSYTTKVINTQPNQGVSMGGNMNGENLNKNVPVPVDASGSTSITTHSTTTTTTTSSGGIGITINQPQQQKQVQQTTTNYLPGYSGPVGCTHPMSPEDFNAMKSTISARPFEDSKLSIAKQSITANCLFASQVKEIMQLFNFEDTKLQFAKYAYPYTYDKGNYFKVNDAFIFDSSTEELNKYISGK